MNKSLISFSILGYIFLSTFASAAQSKEPKRGYRHFYEIETSVSSWKVADNYQFNETEGVVFDNIHRNSFAEVELTTSHGFQFNPNFFLGAGLTGGFSGIHDGWFLGAYIHARTDLTFWGYTPFADFRFGLLTHTGGNFYLSPGIGYRFNFGHRTNLNIGMGDFAICW